MKIGYVTVSNRVMIDGARVRYLYREPPDSDDDSGWRVFSGDESQEYADDPSNFALYNASTLLAQAPEVRAVIGHPYPVEFEWSDVDERFMSIER